MFEVAGIPRATILQMATVGSARVMQEARDDGSLAVGKVALDSQRPRRAVRAGQIGFCRVDDAAYDRGGRGHCPVSRRPIVGHRFVSLSVGATSSGTTTRRRLLCRGVNGLGMFGAGRNVRRKSAPVEVADPDR